MIILNTVGDTIQARAGTTTSITITLYGIETAAAVNTYKKLGQSQISSSSDTTIYTVPSSTSTIISTIVIANTTASDASITLWHVPNAGATGDTNAIMKTINVPANKSIMWNKGSVSLLPANGSGDVLGPSSSTNNNVAFFNGTSGKAIKDSGLTLSGSNTGDQTITLTGNVTGSGTGSFATTIAAGIVTTAMVSSTESIKLGSITFIIDGGGSVITTGIKGDLEIPFACTINRVTLLADLSGSCVIDIWKNTYANYPPTVANTITASALPTISSTTKAQDSTLTGWTTSISAGDTLRFNVNSVATCTRVALILKITRA